MICLGYWSFLNVCGNIFFYKTTELPQVVNLLDDILHVLCIVQVWWLNRLLNKQRERERDINRVLTVFQNFTEVVVTIIDKNDNYPKFKTVSYAGSIKENSRNGTPVFIVSTIYTTFYITNILRTTEKKNYK